MNKRSIEVFTAGCPACDDVVRLVRETACPSCEVEVLDMRTEQVAAKARRYGVKRVPAVAVDGRLAACCQGGVEEAALRELGVGSPL